MKNPRRRQQVFGILQQKMSVTELKKIENALDYYGYMYDKTRKYPDEPDGLYRYKEREPEKKNKKEKSMEDIMREAMRQDAIEKEKKKKEEKPIIILPKKTKEDKKKKVIVPIPVPTRER